MIILIKRIEKLSREIRQRNTIRRSCNLVILLIILFSVSDIFSQRNYERGEIIIRNYHQKEYKGSAQNFSIVQDKRGVMYFANNGGVLEYDGVSWRIIRTSNNSVVKSLAIDENGRIYVGAQNELGYLAPDSTGLLSYYSLLENIPDSCKNFEAVWKVHSTVKGIYFQTSEYLFLWNGEKMKIWKPEYYINSSGSFFINSKLYLYLVKKGLHVMNGDEIVPVIDGEEFADKTITSMIALNNEKIIIATKNNGVFFLTTGGVLYSYHSEYRDPKITGKKSGEKTPTPVFGKETDNFLKEKHLHNIIKINDDLFSFGTQGDGIVIVHKDGYIVRTISKEDGLQDNITEFQFIDSHQNLWIALANGIAKIEITTPISSFTDKSGIKSTVEAIARHNGILYVATHAGLYYLPQKSALKNENTANSRFIPVPSVTTECWDLLSFKKGNKTALIIALNEGIFEVKPNHSLIHIATCSPWVLLQSKKDPSRVYIGLDNGIMSVYYDNGSWINEGKIKGISELIFRIAEDDDGNLWLGTQKQGVLKLNFYMSREMSALVAKKGIERDVKIFRYNEKDGLPSGDFVVIKNKNQPLVFGTEKGIYRFNKQNEKFYPDTFIMKKINREGKGIHRLSIDPNGNIWMVNYEGSEFEVGFAKFLKDSDIIWNSTPFVEISKGIIHAIYHDDNGITWLGGVDGLFRYDPNIDKDYAIPYNSLIRKVTIGDDSVIFKGTNFNEKFLPIEQQSEIFKHQLNYANNSVIFEFAAPNYENENATLYARYLEGFDKGWSEWKSEHKAVYTNLHEGNYVFKVKAKNMYKNISTEATYEFTILPPWYRTIWAYILYLLLFAGTLYVGIKLNSRRLEAKNKELEAIVAERTREVVHQKEVIEHKNRDIMDSINYAQGIQQAILPSDEKFKKYLPDSFILFMPRDVVSGDFYWMECSTDFQSVKNKDTDFQSVKNKNTEYNSVLLAVCDCTGHGVPGGFVSMVGQYGLRKAVNEQGLVQPAQILDSVSLTVEDTFRKGKRKDGMDVVLCCLTNDGNSSYTHLQYSAANNPLYLVRKKENGLLSETVISTKISSLENEAQSVELEKSIEPDIESDTHFLFHLDPDKQPVGAYDYRTPFSNHCFKLKKGDTIYLSSDGFRDQFGGTKGRKFMAKNFKRLLVSIQNKSMDEQKDFLQKSIIDWMGEEEQNDDICVIGVRV